jgi:hypothetical protein
MTRTTARLSTAPTRFLLLLALCASALLALAAAPLATAAGVPAQGGAELSSFTSTVSSLQAGAHADTTISFHLAQEPASVPGPGEFGLEVPKGGAAKDIEVELPRGLLGDPQSAPTCTNGQLNAFTKGCPPSTQVGFAVLDLTALGGVTPLSSAVYNMRPEPGEVARFGLRLGGAVNGFISVKLRDSGDYGVTTTVPNVFSGNPVVGTELTIWGVPADPSHDELRGCENPDLSQSPPTCPEGTHPAGAPLLPFLTNAAQCGVPMSSTIRVDTWRHPGQYTEMTSEPFELHGCEAQAFEPALSVTPTATAASSPTGLNVNLKVPQTWESPTGLATPPLRKTVISLPQGMTISPPSADGLQACSDAQVAIGEDQAADCPEASRLGNVSVTTPLLAEPVSGGIYLGEQKSNLSGSGEMFRIFFVLKNEARGIEIKLPGHIAADPQTGQLTATFDETPQLPFSELNADFKAGPRSPLITPPECGRQTAAAQLSSWSTGSEPVSASSGFEVNQGCAAAGFTPDVEAGVNNPVGGGSSPFTLKVTREDGQQNISQIAATLPEGELAKLANAPLCSDAQAPTGGCDASSQIGTTALGVGAGISPLYVPQPGKAPTAVYLAGPYKGAPYSLVFKVPAQAGPFDLGTIAVRTALEINPETTVVTAKSDPLPQILDGVPVQYRSIYVNIDRPDFMQSPTSCDPMAVTSTITSIGGATANPSSRFQVGSCERLGFGPKLALSLKGGTTRAKNPALKAVLTAPAGQANIGKVQTILPKSVFIDSRHVNSPCTRVQFNEGAGNGSACPAKSILGKATAYSPLLEKPLTGNVYFRSNGGERKLPDLVASLGGQIHINLVGFIDSVKQKGTEGFRVRNTFAAVPDAPVSKFVLELQGGKKGLLQNSTNLCKSTNKATIKMDGQNGKVHDFEQVVKPSCGGKKSKKK